MSGLRATQRWMQAAIQQPATTGRRKTARMLRPSHSLDAAARLSIYQDMYLARMRDALAADYPALLDFLGDDAFRALTEAYVAAHPSRSYTLNRLGDHLPGFIAHQWTHRRRAFLADLARLELAMTEAFDEQESPVLGADGFAGVPDDKWETARLRTVAALRLVEVNYNVGAYLHASRHGRRPPRTLRRKHWVAVLRRDFELFQFKLTRAGFRLLGALQAGTPLGEAVARSGMTERQVFRAFQRWAAEGFLSAVESAV